MEQGRMNKLLDIFLNNLISTQKQVKIMLNTGAVMNGAVANLFPAADTMDSDKKITLYDQADQLILNAELKNIEDIVVCD